MFRQLLREAHWNDFSLYKDEIVKYCLDNEKPNVVESNVATQYKHNLWESKFNFLETDNPAIIKLKVWLYSTGVGIIRELNQKNYNFIINECWAHITNNGGYHLPHSHGQSTWSGIIYIDGDNDAGGKTHWYPPIHLERKPGLDFLESDYHYQPTPGMMVMFPSALVHYVEPYTGTTPRITIAFNAFCV
jgi:hypothetical protein